MSKFVTGTELSEKVYDIIWEAEVELLIVSPYIKLDNYFKTLFDKHINNPKLHILIVFGKNENNAHRSLSSQDFDFFKKFLNVSIVYVPNLHGKYYANENMGVLTSINLYDYSFKSNIEFGVFTEYSLLNSFANSTDKNAYAEAITIAQQGEAVFIKRPVYEKSLLSAFTGKHYIKSDILYDNTKKFYSYQRDSNLPIKRLDDFKDEITLGSHNSDRPSREEIETQQSGYCIRTGVKIPYNPKSPFSYSAYTEWAKYNNPNYPEKYCHKTGQRSNGKTSKSNPILTA